MRGKAAKGSTAMNAPIVCEALLQPPDERQRRLELGGRRFGPSTTAGGFRRCSRIAHANLARRTLTTTAQSLPTRRSNLRHAAGRHTSLLPLPAGGLAQQTLSPPSAHR